MARKKQLRYNDVVRNIAEMQALLTDRRRHMAEALAGALDDRTAALLGDFSDAELRRVASLMFAHAGECAARVKADRRARGVDMDGQRQVRQGVLPQAGAQD